MGDLILMEVVYCFYHLFEYNSRVIFRKTACLVESVEQFSSLAEATFRKRDTLRRYKLID